MIKYFYLMLLTLFICKCTSKQNKQENDFTETNFLKIYKDNNIKKISIYSYIYKFGQIDESSKFLQEISIFSDDYTELRTKTFDRDSSNKDSETSTLDKYSPINQLCIGRQFFHNNGKLKESINYEHDKNGNTSAFSVYDSEGNLKSKVVYNCVGKELCTDIVEYGANGDLQKKTSRIFADGKVTQEIVEDTYGKMIGFSIFEYSYEANMSRITTQETYPEKYSTKNETIIRKDDNGRILSKEFIDSNTLIGGTMQLFFRSIYHLNSKGLIDKAEDFSNLGELKKVNIYKYE